MITSSKTQKKIHIGAGKEAKKKSGPEPETRNVFSRDNGRSTSGIKSPAKRKGNSKDAIRDLLASKQERKKPPTPTGYTGPFDNTDKAMMDKNNSNPIKDKVAKNPNASGNYTGQKHLKKEPEVGPAAPTYIPVSPRKGQIRLTPDEAQRANSPPKGLKNFLRRAIYPTSPPNYIPLPPFIPPSPAMNALNRDALDQMEYFFKRQYTELALDTNLNDSNADEYEIKADTNRVVGKGVGGSTYLYAGRMIDAMWEVPENSALKEMFCAYMKAKYRDETIEFFDRYSDLKNSKITAAMKEKSANEIMSAINNDVYNIPADLKKELNEKLRAGQPLNPEFFDGIKKHLIDTIANELRQGGEFDKWLKGNNIKGHDEKLAASPKSIFSRARSVEKLNYQVDSNQVDPIIESELDESVIKLEEQVVPNEPDNVSLFRKKLDVSFENSELINQFKSMNSGGAQLVIQARKAKEALCARSETLEDMMKFHVTLDEAIGIYLFTTEAGGGKTSLSQQLRGNAKVEPGTLEIAKLATLGMEKLPPAGNLIVYRATDLDAIKSIAGNQAGFTSTTTDSENYYFNKSVVHIKIICAAFTKGRDVKKYSAKPTENEILFPPGTKFKRLKKLENTEGDKKLFTLQEKE